MKRVLTGLSVALSLGALGIVVAPRTANSLRCIVCRAYEPGQFEYDFFLCATCPPEGQER